MDLFKWLYWSSALEFDPELSVRKLHSMRVRIAQARVVPNIGCNEPFDSRESR